MNRLVHNCSPVVTPPAHNLSPNYNLFGPLPSPITCPRLHTVTSPLVGSLPPSSAAVLSPTTTMSLLANSHPAISALAQQRRTPTPPLVSAPSPILPAGLSHSSLQRVTSDILPGHLVSPITHRLLLGMLEYLVTFMLLQSASFPHQVTPRILTKVFDHTGTDNSNSYGHNSGI